MYSRKKESLPTGFGMTRNFRRVLIFYKLDKLLYQLVPIARSILKEPGSILTEKKDPIIAPGIDNSAILIPSIY